MIVAAAKVSTNGVDALEFAKPESAVGNTGLINFLMKHRHGTPFEHGQLTFFVHAPICVWREWHRHRIGHGFNEESGRYKTLEPIFYIPTPDRPLIPEEGFKSARPGFRLPTRDEYAKFVNTQMAVYETAYQAYTDLLGPDPLKPQYDRGCARNILGVGIYSGCWVTVNPRSMMAFLSLRTHEPQAAHVSYPLWEIELAARACEEIFAGLWPITYAAFVKNGRVAP